MGSGNPAARAASRRLPTRVETTFSSYLQERDATAMAADPETSSYVVVWDDHSKNRTVELSLDYQVVEADVQITRVTPLRVTLFDADNGTVRRTLNVHTATGRHVLARAFAASNGGQARALETLRERQLGVGAA